MIQQSLIKRLNNANQIEKKGDYLTALEEYISILKENKEYREVYINLGALYSRMNRLKEAVKCYENALSLSKDYIVYFNLGSVYYKMGQYKKAVINLEKSRKLNNGFILSSLVSGLCFSKLNNINAAETNFKHVLTISPMNHVATTALALIYFTQKRFNESITLLDNLLKANENSTKIRELKSNILFKSGRIDESATEMKTLAKISDGYRLYSNFIRSIPVDTYTDRYGTLDQKIEFLTVLAKKDKNSLISLSLCHLFKGDTDQAIDLLFRVKKTIN